MYHHTSTAQAGGLCTIRPISAGALRAIASGCPATTAATGAVVEVDILRISSQGGPSHMRPAESVVIIAPAGPKEVLRLSAIWYGPGPREQEVVDLVVRGASTRQISQTLHISEYTVKDHLKNIFGKVGVST